MGSYQTVTPADTQALTEFLSKNGQMLPPMVQPIEQSRAALDDVIDVTGRSLIELMLQVSAELLAGAKSPGRKSGQVRHHGTQDGVVHLKERKLRVTALWSGHSRTHLKRQQCCGRAFHLRILM